MATRVNLREYIIKGLILFIGSAAVGFIGGVSTQIKYKTDEKTVTITIEKGNIQLTETDEIPKVEEVEGSKFDLGTLNARGEFFRTDTFENFITDTENKCVIEGNVYGAQCVSLAQAFWTNYAGYGLSDCGTGAARGIWFCKDENARDDFEIVEGSQNLQPGDWVVFNSGTWGHIGMVYDYPKDGYIPLYGENQGGKKCEAGGSQPNFILLSDKTMLGAFRPKDYIKCEPIPVPDSGAVR